MPTKGLDGRDGSPALAPNGPDHSPDDLRTFVTVSRAHDDDVRHRQIIVRVDDDPNVTLVFGESFTREIKPGTHRIRAHNTLFRKTVAFSVEPGERIEFVVINRAGPMTLGFLALMGAAPLYLTIERRSPA